MISASQNFPQIMPVFFEGKIYSTTNLPWYYLPKWILISKSLITLFFFAIGNINVFAKTLSKNVFNKTNISYLYIFTLLWIPILLAVFEKPVIYDSWRHFLFLAGPIAILSTLGFYSLIKIKLFSYTAVFLFIVNIILTTGEMVNLHPYEYIYFNSLTGGLKGASQRYETDYWGASFKEATDWIYKNKKSFAASDGNIYINPCLTHLAVPYLKPGMIMDDKKAAIDYFFTRNHPLCKKSEGKIIHIIKREGVPLNIIQKEKAMIY